MRRKRATNPASFTSACFDGVLTTPEVEQWLKPRVMAYMADQSKEIFPLQPRQSWGRSGQHSRMQSAHQEALAPEHQRNLPQDNSSGRLVAVEWSRQQHRAASVATVQAQGPGLQSQLHVGSSEGEEEAMRHRRSPGNLVVGPHRAARACDEIADWQVCHSFHGRHIKRGGRGNGRDHSHCVPCKL